MFVTSTGGGPAQVKRSSANWSTSILTGSFNDCGGPVDGSAGVGVRWSSTFKRRAAKPIELDGLVEQRGRLPFQFRTVHLDLQAVGVVAQLLNRAAAADRTGDALGFQRNEACRELQRLSQRAFGARPDPQPAERKHEQQRDTGDEKRQHPQQRAADAALLLLLRLFAVRCNRLMCAATSRGWVSAKSAAALLAMPRLRT